MPDVPISSGSSACLHLFALYVFAESPLGCLYNTSEEILSCGKGPPRHDN